MVFRANGLVVWWQYFALKLSLLSSLVWFTLPCNFSSPPTKRPPSFYFIKIMIIGNNLGKYDTLRSELKVFIIIIAINFLLILLVFYESVSTKTSTFTQSSLMFIKWFFAHRILVPGSTKKCFFLFIVDDIAVMLSSMVFSDRATFSTGKKSSWNGKNSYIKQDETALLIPLKWFSNKNVIHIMLFLVRYGMLWISYMIPESGNLRPV